MIIRKSPTNKNDFVMVISDVSQKLHEMGFIPKYIDEDYIYYVKCKEILKAIKLLERSKNNE